MKIGVLGTGMVGQAIATKLVDLGHDVMMGSRTANNEKAVTWASEAGGRHGTFAEAAGFGDLLVNATNGSGSIEALTAAGEQNLTGKVLVDISNPVDGSSGFPPALTVRGEDSLAEQIQRAFPSARVVKTLNTVTAGVMVEPGLIPGSHNVFLSGDDEHAKGRVRTLLESFGWPADDIVDLGGLDSARGAELYLGFWLRAMRALGTPQFNVKILRATH